MFSSASFARFAFACMALFLGGCIAMTPDARLCRTYPEKSEKRTAAEFLLANLPPSDRATLSTEDLRENIDYAFAARSETAWGASVPFDIFLHYVLPHRLINEPFSPWRKQFHDELMPLVKESRSLLEAAIRVNLWCAGQVEYRPSSSWLVAPVDLLKVGFGRCEELTILFAAAARSVGIPVRGCWVPAWRHTDDNHVWAEVWDNGEWIPLEAASSVVDPNENWFLGPARAAPAVYSPVYGDLHRPDGPVYRRGNGYTTLNLTGRYAETAEFTVSCVYANKHPATGQKVALWTFNHGLPQPVARGVTDATGAARFLLGRGSYIASTGDGVGATAAEVSADQPTSLDMGDSLPDAWVWTLWHPSADSALHRFPGLDRDTEARLHKEAARSAARLQARKARMEIQINILLERHVPIPHDVVTAFKAPWPSSVRLAEEFFALMEEEQRSLAPLITRLNPKDLAILSLRPLAGMVRQRDHAMTHWQHVDSSLFLSDVADPRINREPFSLPGQYEDRLAHSLIRDSSQNTVAAIVHHVFAAGSGQTNSTAFTASLPTAPMANHVATASRSDRLTLCVSRMRSLGIPARLSALHETVMYFDGTGFRPAPGIPDIMQCIDDSILKDQFPGKLALFSNLGVFDELPWPPKALPMCFHPGRLLHIEISRSGNQVQGTLSRSEPR